ncbi:MAG: right-handed parallel beta-helix repeat-containing protein [Candidatus Omnitrophota bacterium]|nr:MAG: right-handed parallel beta-helix repeat-containing protein [Candidatus Omnitrophota bacterium]
MGIYADTMVPFDTLSPSHHIVVENCTFKFIGYEWSSHDALKMMWTDYYTIRNCYFEGWSEQAIDSIGVQHGVIEYNQVIGGDVGMGYVGQSGIQLKGGSNDVLVHRNFLRDAGQMTAGLKIGGSTGLSYFRTPAGTGEGQISYEAKDIEFGGNRLIRNNSARDFDWATSDGGDVHHNTFLNHTYRLAEISKEDVSHPTLGAMNGIFRDNLVVLDDFWTDYLIKIKFPRNTSPDTFTFDHNAWFDLVRPLTDSVIANELPVTETNSIYGINPELDSNMAITSPNPVFYEGGDPASGRVLFGADAYEITNPKYGTPVTEDMVLSAEPAEEMDIRLKGHSMLGGEAGALTYNFESAPAGFTAAPVQDPINPNHYLYTTPETSGAVSFSYSVTQDGITSDPSTVTILAILFDDAPYAVDDAASTNEDNPVTIDVLDNDSAGDNPSVDNGEIDPSTVTIVTKPANGTCAVNPETGAVTYTPNPDSFGEDMFTYNFSTTLGVPSREDDGTVTVTVNAVNDPPFADDKLVGMLSGATSCIIDLVGRDVEDDLLTYNIVEEPSSGSLNLSTIGPIPAGEPALVTYFPDTGTTQDTFTYTITDNGTPPETSRIISVEIKSADIISGLLARWRFDETEGDTAADSSGNGYSGTLVNGPTWIEEGRLEGALEFNRSLSQYVDCGNPIVFSPGSAISISVWVRATDTQAYDYILSKPCSSTSTASYALYTGSDNTLYFYILPLGGSSGVRSPSGGNIADGQWHHIAGTYDKEYVRLYVDGVEVGSGTARTSDIEYNEGRNLIIANSDLGNHYWNGAIDDVRIYNVALTAAQIAALAAGTEPLPGDVNNDGKVDITDLVIVAQAFGSQPGDSNWDSRADLNNDNVVDIDDLVVVAQNFGRGT